MIRIKETSYGVKQGDKYGKLLVLGKPFCVGANTYLVVVKCDCGEIYAGRCNHISSGKATKCVVCSKRRHGGYGTRLYRIWTGIKDRCCNERCSDFVNYMGRGIGVCEEWKNSFPTFRKWALENGYTKELQIDRKDNGGDYEPSNCRWVSFKTNSRNTRANLIIEAFGESKCVAEWLEDERCVVCRSTIMPRLKSGWKPEFAFTVKPLTNGVKPKQEYLVP